MKRILTAILACVLVLSMVACTKAPVENNDVENNDVENNGEVAATLGASMLEIFKSNYAEDKTAEEIANAVVTEANLPFGPMVMPVEAGLLPGFDNYEVTGFEEGAAFMPMIGSIPFVGYIFKLPADADVEAFKTALSENSNRRWNICVEAEETVVENEGNTVFFLMCPASLEQEPAGDVFEDELLDGEAFDGAVVE